MILCQQPIHLSALMTAPMRAVSSSPRKMEPLYPSRAILTTLHEGHPLPKMAHYEQTVHSPLRLKTPLKRTGPKGSGQFEPISWDQAIKAIAKEFTHCIDTYGSESLYSYSYAGTMGLIGSPAANPLFALLGASQQDRGICSPAKNTVGRK